MLLVKIVKKASYLPRNPRRRRPERRGSLSVVKEEEQAEEHLDVLVGCVLEAYGFEGSRKVEEGKFADVVVAA